MKSLLYATILVSFSGIVLSPQSIAVPEVKIAVDDKRCIKKVDPGLLGINYSWVGLQSVCGDGNGAGFDPQIVKLLNGVRLPLNRVSGTSANIIRWKDAVGAYEKRGKQQLAKWWRNGKKLGLGPVEFVKMVQTIDPKAEFTWTVNLHASPEETADLVEFLTGDGNSNPNGGINWARKRIEYGIRNPVPVRLWELGNELDGPDERNKFNSMSIYTDYCRKHIDAIRSVKPDAKIAAHAATFSSLVTYAAFFGGTWEIWHRYILKKLGSDIDYIAFHSYCNSLPSSRLENDVNTIAKDIRKITGSDRIKIYISEYAWWPKTAECRPGSKNWKECWYTTHALVGCLGTADWIVRMMNSNSIELAAYHSFTAGPWGMIYKSDYDESHKRSNRAPLHTTGIWEMYRLFSEAYKGAVEIVPVKVSGNNTDRRRPECMFTCAALKKPDELNIIMVNRDPEAGRMVTLDVAEYYRPVDFKILTADNLLDFNTSKSRPIKVEKRTFQSGKGIDHIEIPSKSLILLRLKRL